MFVVAHSLLTASGEGLADYLCNVISALDVTPTAELLVMSKLVGASETE